jgi:serine/threonine protein kinase
MRREVALKVLPERVCTDPEAVARFEQEARTVAVLSHPNIATIFEVGRAGDSTFAAMELLEGATLRTHLRSGPLPVGAALDYAVRIGEAVGAAHAGGIVHRDLKPENVFLMRDGGLKVLDFGLARAIEPASFQSMQVTAQHFHTRTGAKVGTLSYMAPEQLSGEEVDTRADIFSFGCILYEMLSGAQPFRGQSVPELMTAILTTPPPPLSADGRVSPSLERIVAQCLQKEPAERSQSIAGVVEALRGEVPKSRGRAPEPRRPAASRSSAPSPTRSQASTIALAGGLIVIGLLGAAAALWFLVLR